MCELRKDNPVPLVVHMLDRFDEYPEISDWLHQAAWEILFLLGEMPFLSPPMGLRKMKSLFMESTEISPEKTIAEIEEVLIRYGANAVLKEYSSGVIEAVSFRVKVNAQDIPFRLPCRWKAIENLFIKRSRRTWRSDAQKKSDADKARRVAWRQIFRWVQAQLALVDTEMVKVEEVFFPYIQTKGGQTLYELQAGSLALLPERT